MIAVTQTILITKIKMSKTILLVAAALVTQVISPVSAEVPNYLGVSTTTNINSTNNVSFSGKFKVPTKTPLSVRPELTLTQNNLVGGGLALTLDTAVPGGTLYSGFGVSVNQLFPTSSTTTYGVIGLETALTDRYNAYSSVKLPFTRTGGEYTPSVTFGLGYSI